MVTDTESGEHRCFSLGSDTRSGISPREHCPLAPGGRAQRRSPRLRLPRGCPASAEGLAGEGPTAHRLLGPLCQDWLLGAQGHPADVWPRGGGGTVPCHTWLAGDQPAPGRSAPGWLTRWPCGPAFLPRADTAHPSPARVQPQAPGPPTSSAASSELTRKAPRTCRPIPCPFLAPPSCGLSDRDPGTGLEQTWSVLYWKGDAVRDPANLRP